MHNDTIKKLSRRARFVAAKFGYANEAEDIAQEVLCGYIKAPKSKQTVEQAVIDWLRQNGGRTRGGSPRIALRDCNVIDEKIASNLPASTRSDRADIQSLERYLIGLEKTHRCIAILFYVWGLSEQEVGHCFGISGIRVSQILSEIHKRICKTISGGTEKRSKYKKARKREMEKMGQIKGSRLSIYSSPGLAKSQPATVESHNETGFDEWLT